MCCPAWAILASSVWPSAPYWLGRLHDRMGCGLTGLVLPIPSNFTFLDLNQGLHWPPSRGLGWDSVMLTVVLTAIALGNHTKLGRFNPATDEKQTDKRESRKSSTREKGSFRS